jgi:hypothetical protein
MCGSGQAPVIMQSRWLGCWLDRFAIGCWMKSCGVDGFVVMAVAAIFVHVHIF